jgi:hypothetical protein
MVSLILPILLLAGAVLACSGGYNTSTKISGNSGEIRIKTREADGEDSTSVELSEDWENEWIAATATLNVAAGSCQASLLGQEGTVLVLEASAGSPGQAAGDLQTNIFGDISLQTNCQGAQDLDLLVQFRLK